MTLNLSAAMNSYLIENKEQLSDKTSKLLSESSSGKFNDSDSVIYISQGVKNQPSNMVQVLNIINSAIALVDVSEQSLGEMNNILNSIKQKAIQMASNGSSDIDKASIKSEIIQMISSYDSYIDRTNYNGIYPFKLDKESVNFQFTLETQKEIEFSLSNISSSNIGGNESLYLSNFNKDFLDSATTGIGVKLSSVIDSGRLQLDNVKNELTSISINIQTLSKEFMKYKHKSDPQEVKNINYASESYNFTKSNILNQSGSFQDTQASKIDHSKKEKLLGLLR